MKAQPLFPGKTCFPLSAGRKERGHSEKLDEEFRAETHQLMKIFDVIGTPARWVCGDALSVERTSRDSTRAR